MQTPGKVLALAGALLWLATSPASAADLSTLDLTGEWYILVHWKSDRSEDASVLYFKDFAWSLKHEDKKITLVTFPYVLFREDLEEVRREAMTSHRGWEPSPAVWDRIRKKIGVSSRAKTKKTLRGSRQEGYESPPAMGGSGANMMTYSVDWTMTFAPEAVRISITDSLSGGEGLDGISDSTVYEITEQVSDDELHGSYRESHKAGTFKMVRSKKHEVLK